MKPIKKASSAYIFHRPPDAHLYFEDFVWAPLYFWALRSTIWSLLSVVFCAVNLTGVVMYRQGEGGFSGLLEKFPFCWNQIMLGTLLRKKGLSYRVFVCRRSHKQRGWYISVAEGVFARDQTQIIVIPGSIKAIRFYLELGPFEPRLSFTFGRTG